VFLFLLHLHFNPSHKLSCASSFNDTWLAIQFPTQVSTAMNMTIKPISKEASNTTRTSACFRFTEDMVSVVDLNFRLECAYVCVCGHSICLGHHIFQMVSTTRVLTCHVVIIATTYLPIYKLMQTYKVVFTIDT